MELNSFNSNIKLMLSGTDLKIGRVIKFNGQPYAITFSEHTKSARSQAYIRTKLRHITTGSVMEKTFASGDKIEEADLEKKDANYLYNDGANYFFMDLESYEEISFSKDQLGLIPNFIKEGITVIIQHFEGKPVTVEIPKKVILKITMTEPAIRGNTASGSVNKTAEVETGYTLQVPIFVEQGENIVINTDTGYYVERANK